MDCFPYCGWNKQGRRTEHDQAQHGADVSIRLHDILGSRGGSRRRTHAQGRRLLERMRTSAAYVRATNAPDVPGSEDDKRSQCRAGVQCGRSQMRSPLQGQMMREPSYRGSRLEGARKRAASAVGSHFVSNTRISPLAPPGWCRVATRSLFHSGTKSPVCAAKPDWMVSIFS